MNLPSPAPNLTENLTGQIRRKSLSINDLQRRTRFPNDRSPISRETSRLNRARIETDMATPEKTTTTSEGPTSPAFQALNPQPSTNHFQFLHHSCAISAPFSEITDRNPLYINNL